MNSCASCRDTPMSFASVNACLAVEQRVVDDLRPAPQLVLAQAADAAEHLRRGAVVDVLAAREGLDQHLLAREVRQHAQLDLRVVGGDEHVPGSATKARRISRPTSVRIGMFCRLGSLLLKRPVAATAWLKQVWTRPVSGCTSCGSAST